MFYLQVDCVGDIVYALVPEKGYTDEQIVALLNQGEAKFMDHAEWWDADDETKETE